jgi:photosystem II stability/assembly factor-like uncharacterized protein
MKALPCIALAFVLLAPTTRVQAQSLRDILTQENKSFFEIDSEAVAYFDSINAASAGWKQAQDTLEDDELINYTRWYRQWIGRLDTNAGMNRAGYEMLQHYNLETPIQCSPNAYQGKWVNTGPFRTPASVGNPDQGQIHAIAVHPTDTSIIYVGSQHGGVWKTINGGQSWRSLMSYETLPPIGIRSIVINPHDPDMIVVASAAKIGFFGYDATPYVGYGLGVIVSFDAGESWENTELAFDPTDPFYSWGQQEVFKLLLIPSMTTDTVIHVHAMTKNSVYVLKITASRVGESKTLIQGGPNWAPYGHRDMASYHGSRDTLWITTSKAGLLRTLDGGTSWDTLDTYQLPTGSYSHFVECQHGSNIDQMLITHRLNRLWMMENIGDDNCQNHKRTLQYSDDLGNTWNGFATNQGIGLQNIFDISETDTCIYVRGSHNHVRRLRPNLMDTTIIHDYTHVDPRSFLVFKYDTLEILYQGNDGGINISTNHVNWRDITGNGLAIGQYYGIGLDSADVHKYMSGAQDGSVNRYLYGTWLRAGPFTDHGEVLFDHEDSDFVYMASNNSIIRSTNGGQTFGTPIITGDGSVVTAVFTMNLHPRNPDTLFVGFSSLWRTNSARTATTAGFVEVHDPYSNSWRVQSIEISRADPDIVYYSYMGYHYEDAVATKGLLFRASNGGLDTLSWKDITGAMGRDESGSEAPLYYGPVNDITTDPLNPARVWVCFGGFGTGRKVYYSADTGNTWTNMSGGLPNLPANSIVYQYGSNDRLYLGMDGGVWYWEPDSSKWYRYCGGFPNAIVFDMDIHDCGQLLRVATYGRGIWEVPLIPPDPISVDSSTTWSGARNIIRDVHVPSGVTLTVAGTVNMAQHRKMVVERGGTLVVDGGTVTNSCHGMWEGIEVWGHNKIAHPTVATAIAGSHPYHGVVVVKNGGLIENARTGITTVKKDNGYPDLRYSGGIVLAFDSATFRNNKKAVEFWKFRPKIFGAIRDTNISFFSECVFETTSKLNDPHTRPETFVSMWDVSGVVFTNNTFRYDMGAGYPEIHRGTGITSVDASYRVVPRCTGQSQPCDSWQGNLFENLHRGIEARGSGGVKGYLAVWRNNFVNVNYGILLSAVNFSDIYDNVFSVPSFQAPYPFALGGKGYSGTALRPRAHMVLQLRVTS